MLIPFGILSAAGAGGVAEGTYELISTTVLGSTTASVTFSNLGDYASTYKHLQIRLAARTDRATFAIDAIALSYNGDTTDGNYNRHFLEGNGSSATSYSSNDRWFGLITGSQAAANSFGAGCLDILEFSSSSKFKTLRASTGFVSPAAGGVSGTFVNFAGSAWRNTAAITSIALTSGLGNNFISGSRFSIYGIRG
jgi:hypothetical protein